MGDSFKRGFLNPFGDFTINFNTQGGVHYGQLGHARR